MKVIHSSQIIAHVKNKLTAKIVYASVVENTKKLFFPKVTNCFSKQKKHLNNMIHLVLDVYLALQHLRLYYLNERYNKY